MGTDIVARERDGEQRNVTEEERMAAPAARTIKKKWIAEDGRLVCRWVEIGGPLSLGVAQYTTGGEGDGGGTTGLSCRTDCVRLLTDRFATRLLGRRATASPG